MYVYNFQSDWKVEIIIIIIIYIYMPVINEYQTENGMINHNYSKNKYEDYKNINKLENLKKLLCRKGA